MLAPKENNLIYEYLLKGDFKIEGQFMWGSNYTFLSELSYQGQKFKTVYKPIGGERPLWDFPSETLAGREVAAYLVSEAGGWHFVPPTVFRQEGPKGPGSLQFFIDHDPEYHYFTFSSEDRRRLGQVALFDAVINNTDRKGGHVIMDDKNYLWTIDHGVCFHAQPKLRSVIWDFAGNKLSNEDCQKLTDLRKILRPDKPLYRDLSEYLSVDELAAMVSRMDELLTLKVFPSPSQDRRSHPWPPV